MCECEPVCCSLVFQELPPVFSAIAPSLCLFFFCGPDIFGCWCGEFCCEPNVFDNVSNHGAPLALACVTDKSENSIQVGVFFPALLSTCYVHFAWQFGFKYALPRHLVLPGYTR